MEVPSEAHRGLQRQLEERRDGLFRVAFGNFFAELRHALGMYSLFGLVGGVVLGLFVFSDTDTA